MIEGLEGLGNSDLHTTPRSLMAPKGAGGYIFSYVLKVLELGVDYISVRPLRPRYGGILLLLLFTRLEACHLRHSHAVCVYLGFALAIYSVLEPPTLKV